MGVCLKIGGWVGRIRKEMAVEATTDVVVMGDEMIDPVTGEIIDQKGLAE